MEVARVLVSMESAETKERASFLVVRSVGRRRRDDDPKATTTFFDATLLLLSSAAAAVPPPSSATEDSLAGGREESGCSPSTECMIVVDDRTGALARGSTAAWKIVDKDRRGALGALAGASVRKLAPRGVTVTLGPRSTNWRTVTSSSSRISA